jgi:biopolymer transport protein TolR
MAVKLGGDDDEGIVDINITPFVDIILVVLIIFMVTATYIVEESIKVNLPEAATGEATEDVSLAISMDASKKLYLDGEETTESQLRKRLQNELLDAKSNKVDVICLIGADKTVSHGDVIHIIDLVKQEGVTKFAINIDPIEVLDLKDRITESNTTSPPTE